jgi:hypothetical protein
MIYLKIKTENIAYLHSMSYICSKIENKDRYDTESKV